MNYQDSRSVTTAGKLFSSTALALVVGLALAFFGSAAMALEPGEPAGTIVLVVRGTAPLPPGSDLPTASNPIPGVDIIVQKKPGPSIPVSAPTNNDGTYKFTGLAPGKYDLSIAGERVQTITVGANKTISGILSREPDGTASITFNGKTGSVLVGPAGAPVNTSRSNKKAGIVKGEEAGPDGGDEILPGLAGQPIPGVDVKLGKNPGGSIVASSKTGNQGNFHFDKLPAGNYKLIIPGLPDQSLSIGADGIAGGSVKRGSDGSMAIFDRWGNSFAAPGGDAKQDNPDQAAGSKAAESPVGFGSGNNAMGAGPGAGLGAGPGMFPPGAAMGGTGPMSPGAGPMGGPGGPGPMSPVGPGPMSPGAGGPMGGSPGGAMRP